MIERNQEDVATDYLVELAKTIFPPEMVWVNKSNGSQLHQIAVGDRWIMINWSDGNGWWFDGKILADMSDEKQILEQIRKRADYFKEHNIELKHDDKKVFI